MPQVADAGPRTHFVRAGGGTVHVTEWGSGNLETVVMWHGLARTSADFEPLAAALAGKWRVLCIDAPGRGLSTWPSDPSLYGFDHYEAVVDDVCRLFGANAMMWVGTSMGGALGIRLAGSSFAHRITHLVVNDIGPEVPQAAVDRILAYVSRPPVVPDMEALEARLREMYRPYGSLSDARWKRMAVASARRLPDGTFTLHYDPRIVEQFVRHRGDYELWPQWRAIRCGVLVLHGTESDVLPSAVVDRMLDENEGACVVEVPGVGHAPALADPEQIAAVADFLDQPTRRAA
jgi:pimeloyl-ACP methyl ester carboxylesterase